MRRIARLSAIWVAFGICALPSLARACPVCFASQNDENRIAYVVSSVGLTLLPFAVLGGILFWVWRRAKAADVPAPVAPESVPASRD